MKKLQKCFCHGSEDPDNIVIMQVQRRLQSFNQNADIKNAGIDKQHRHYKRFRSPYSTFKNFTPMETLDRIIDRVKTRTEKELTGVSTSNHRRVLCSAVIDFNQWLVRENKLYAKKLDRDEVGVFLNKLKLAIRNSPYHISDHRQHKTYRNQEFNIWINDGKIVKLKFPVLGNQYYWLDPGARQMLADLNDAAKEIDFPKLSDYNVYQAVQPLYAIISRLKN